MKVVLVHDWLIHMRGGEKVLEALAELYPDAPIYTLFFSREKLSPVLQNREIHASFFQRIPGIRSFYRWLLPWMPWAIRSLDLPASDLVISTSHCVAKGVRVPRGAVHVSYCHTPMRYLYGFGEEYFGNMPRILKPFLSAALSLLRRWDKASNQSVDCFIANSENVRKRIQTCYGRDSEVIHPPVNSRYFTSEGTEAPKDYYLVVSAFVPYKRVDLVIEAFNKLDRPLAVVGHGPLEETYRALRKSPRISFLGAVPDKELRVLMSEARALIFPTEEDFGIVPLEAQACGTPVIAYGKGGALESVKSGVFFEDQTAESLQRAVLHFESLHFDRTLIPAKISQFSKENFIRRVAEFVAGKTQKGVAGFAQSQISTAS